MGETKRADGIAAQKLTDTMVALILRNQSDKIAGYGYIQANMAHCASQALIDLLRHKNIISEEEINRALTHAYNTRIDQLVGNSIVLPPAPQVRPSDKL